MQGLRRLKDSASIKYENVPELNNPIINTVFLLPSSESANHPHSMPVQTWAAVFAPTIIPAWVESKESEIEGLKNLSW